MARLLLHGHLRTYFREFRNAPLPFRKKMQSFKTDVRLALQPFANRIKSLAGRRVRKGRLDRFVKPSALDDAIATGIVRREEFGIDAGLETDGRNLVARALHKVSNRIPESAINMTAWAEGLATTRPFHDKRVVELALAIPQSLYFKNGRSRHLARTALADVYPTEFQDRPLRNDRRVADWEEALSAAGPDLVARAQNLPDDVVDREGIADALRAEQPWDETKSSALNVLMVADYRRWFTGRNSS
jgi:asparagine synthase (glutamine-hydrolysing)